MNIKQAKEYIKQSVLMYLKKDEFGEYRIPVRAQRPVFLLGAPGIGKTAIMEQIAQEMSIALVSYSMTHHTRQSALGLPYITEKDYNGLKSRVSEYTMSEIIASVYDTIEASGKKEGILFLDEINCVSETLAPSMLQFLQYKVFGKHTVPEGWVVVTAGNPPEFNRSVREFDVVTMDRLKLLEVAPDYECWREYALDMGVHNVILSFLELKKEYFYKIETTVSGRSYVTARGWEDLSTIIKMYEEEGYTVDENLVGQYINNDRISREFSAYYELYNRYRRNYAIDDILAGNISEDSIKLAAKAAFDERLSLVSMLLDRTMSDIKAIMEEYDYHSDLVNVLKAMKGIEDGRLLSETVDKERQKHENLIYTLKSAGAMSNDERRKQLKIINFLQQANKNAANDGFSGIKQKYDESILTLRERTEAAKTELKSMFDFVNSSFGEENEMLIVVSALTAGKYSAAFIGRFGSDEYKKYSKRLMVTDEMENAIKEYQELSI